MTGNGSPRLTFIGFDLASNAQATATLEALARESGGRLLQADARGELSAMLSAGVTSTVVGSGGGGPMPYGVRNTSGGSRLGTLAIVAITLNLLLMLALIGLRAPHRRARVLRLLRRQGRSLLLLFAVGLLALTATPARAGFSAPQPGAAAAQGASPAETAPVLLIPGIFGSADSFSDLAFGLSARSWSELPVIRFDKGKITPSCVVEAAIAAAAGGAPCLTWEAVAIRAVRSLPPRSRFMVRLEMMDNAQLTFAEQGERVRAAVALVRQATGAPQVRLAGHSMGGLAARAYLQGRSYAGDVEELISIATPHGGSLLPYAQQIYDGVIPDLTAPLPADQMRPHLMSVDFDDASGDKVSLTFAAPLGNDNGQRRLYGQQPPQGGLFRTLYEPARRREAYTRVLRELATLPRVRAHPSWVGSRLTRLVNESGILSPEDGEHLLFALQGGAEILNKRYVKGGTYSANLQNSIKTLARGVRRHGRALEGASVALAGLGFASEMTDALAGALLIRALATDEAFERLSLLRQRLLGLRARGNVDPVLEAALNEALTELEEAQNLMGSLVQEVARNAGALSSSGANLGVAIANYAGKISAKAAVWFGVALVAYDLSRTVSDQWELAQEASLMVTLALEWQVAAPDDALTTAYAQRAFFEMMAEALSGRMSRLNDLMSRGAANRDLTALYRGEADRLRLLGPVEAPCVKPTSAASLLRILEPAAKTFKGIDVSAPTVDRLAPDATELRALNMAVGERGYGALPAAVRYVTVIAEAGDPPPVPSCAVRHFKPVSESALIALSRTVQAAGASRYRLDPSQVPMSEAFVLARSDLVVPVALQSLSSVRAGWSLQPQVEVIPAHHLAVTRHPALVPIIDRPSPSVATSGPATGGTAVDRVLMVLDVSGSMQGRRLDEAREAVRVAVGGMPATTEVSLQEFGGSCQVRETVPFTAERGRIHAAIDQMRAFGDTPLLEAMLTAAAAVRASPSPERMAVVVVTDGAPSCGYGQMNPTNVARELGLALKLIR